MPEMSHSLEELRREPNTAAAICGKKPILLRVVRYRHEPSAAYVLRRFAVTRAVRHNECRARYRARDFSTARQRRFSVSLEAGIPRAGEGV